MKQAVARRTAQSGVALVVALVLLVVVALLGVSAVSNSTTNLRAVMNTQTSIDAEMAAQDGVEQTLALAANFEPPTAKNYTVGNFSVAVPAPVCLGTGGADGYSALFQFAPQSMLWSVSATATDTLTGAKSSVTQGVGLQLPAGLCN